ncbi:protein disulfide isomerase-like 1-4 [Diospyros lotus]|uniref:protein disulfide isomerase-like 1-4 n=1 Tax=Diospyros lotus TaxID=55363 RepID=UPI0022588E0E|nr:protein disulfide isomerase-like 1-4 [Diospyros lotus]
MAVKSLLFFSVSVLILLSIYCSAATLSNDDEDLSFLEDSDAESSHPDQYQRDFENYDDLYEDDGALDSDDHEAYSTPVVDEKDVVVLKDSNFSNFIAQNRYVMVEFYAPWCGHCQALAPEYAAAATELKGEAVLAKVDAAEETDLAQKYEIQGFPTVFFFIDGVHKDYPGQRTKDAIVTWVKKKTGPGIYNLTTVEEAERILTSESKVVLGFLDTLVGPQSEELAAASRLEDDVSFYQTASTEVAKLFHIDPQAKRPALVLLKKEAEKISHFDGQFTKSEITQFVYENKLPLVTIFTREIAPLIFENPIKKQLLLFATSNDSIKLIPTFQEAAKPFKGKLIFVIVEMDNEDFGKPVSEYFGVAGDAPRVLAYTGNDDARKFVLDGKLTLSNIKSFAEDFLDDKLKPFYKSDPVPETNDGDVKIVVGNNFDEIVLDESKDVLLEIYAPWCGHCQALEPIYNKLGKYLRGIDSLVIAKMDGTTNEHPRAKADGFPTLLFFPAGNKSFDPITVDTDRTVVAFYKFLKKHATIPFKLQKPAESQKPKESDDTESQNSSNETVKDEL